MSEKKGSLERDLLEKIAKLDKTALKAILHSKKHHTADFAHETDKIWNAWTSYDSGAKVMCQNIRNKHDATLMRISHPRHREASTQLIALFKDQITQANDLQVAIEKSKKQADDARTFISNNRSKIESIEQAIKDKSADVAYDEAMTAYKTIAANLGLLTFNEPPPEKLYNELSGIQTAVTVRLGQIEQFQVSALWNEIVSHASGATSIAKSVKDTITAVEKRILSKPNHQVAIQQTGALRSKELHELDILVRDLEIFKQSADTHKAHSDANCEKSPVALTTLKGFASKEKYDALIALQTKIVNALVSIEKLAAQPVGVAAQPVAARVPAPAQPQPAPVGHQPAAVVASAKPKTPAETKTDREQPPVDTNPAKPGDKPGAADRGDIKRAADQNAEKEAPLTYMSAALGDDELILNLDPEAMEAALREFNKFKGDTLEFIKARNLSIREHCNQAFLFFKNTLQDKASSEQLEHLSKTILTVINREEVPYDLSVLQKRLYRDLELLITVKSQKALEERILSQLDTKRMSTEESSNILDTLVTEMITELSNCVNLSVFSATVASSISSDAMGQAGKPGEPFLPLAGVAAGAAKEERKHVVSGAPGPVVASGGPRSGSPSAAKAGS